MEEIDLKELLSLINEKKFIIITFVLLFLILGIVYSYYLVVPAYTAETKIVLTKDEADTTNQTTSNGITTTDVTLNSKLISTYSVLIKSKDVVRKVIENLKLGVDENSVIKNIAVSSVGESEVISIKVTNHDPALASQIANEITKVFSDQVSELYKLNNVKIVDKAETPNSPSNINHPRDLAVFALVGLAISVTYVFVINLLDNTVKSQDEIEKTYGTPVLAVIPYVEIDSKK